VLSVPRSRGTSGPINPTGEGGVFYAAFRRAYGMVSSRGSPDRTAASAVAGVTDGEPGVASSVVLVGAPRDQQHGQAGGNENVVELSAVSAEQDDDRDGGQSSHCEAGEDDKPGARRERRDA
jgi:hypothetical protein